MKQEKIKQETIQIGIVPDHVQAQVRCYCKTCVEVFDNFLDYEFDFYRYYCGTFEVSTFIDKQQRAAKASVNLGTIERKDLLKEAKLYIRIMKEKKICVSKWHMEWYRRGLEFKCEHALE